MKCPKCNFENPDNARFCGNCTEPLTPSEKISPPHTETLETPRKELTTGSTFAGRYQVIEELGSGGMGKVYKVVDKDIKEKIALKLLNPEIAADKKTIERFGNELKFARKISHRNVCRMYDLGKEEGTHYITMEYVPGEDLRSTIRRIGQLPVGKSISIAKQVCEGLAEAHGLGVVHRDLKPQNIMIDREGNARVMDFGIARSLGAKGITGAGIMIGTPEYMSPEQVEGKEADQRSDIYSLGVILYEMVTGQVPFEGETPLSIAVKHKTEVPRDPKQLNSQIPEDLSRMILRCMEKERDKRYKSAESILSEIIKIEEGIPTTERVLPERKPLTTKEITVTFRLQKLFVPALIFFALIIIGVIIWRLVPRKEAVPLAPSGKSSLAIMYFENNTGDESLDHYRKAISDLLITDLAQSKYIRVLSGARIFNILSQLNQLEAKSYSSDVLREVAARGGVDHILMGSYTKAGDTFRINVTLQEARTAELVGSEGVEGVGKKSIFSMVDELTKKIKENFKLSPEDIASDIDKEIGEITTSSPEAYKYYSQGTKYDHKGEYRQSIQLMEKAVAIDPEFAMAYRSMAITYMDLGYYSKQREYLQKALELSDRVSDRERYQIQGDFYLQSEKTYDKAIEAYKKLLELYPEDSDANINLGALYSDLEEWDKARERCEVLRQAKDESIFPYIILARVSSAKGLYDEAREIYEYYLNNIADNATIHLRLARNYSLQKKFDLALTEVDKASLLNPGHYTNFITKGDIYFYKGDLIKAEKEYRKLLEEEELRLQMFNRELLGVLYLLQGRFEESKNQIKQGMELARKIEEKTQESWCHLLLGYIYLKSGNHEEALEECDKAWKGYGEVDVPGGQRYALYTKGLAFLDMKSMDEAQRAADELKEMVEKAMNRKEIRLYHNLMGMIELERENFPQAIEYLKKAISLLPAEYNANYGHAAYFDPLALAYYKSGDLEKAQEEYERIISLTAGRAYYGDVFVKSFYMLGKIFEEKGWEGKAIEHYEKFLDLWKDADPGIPEVSDTKKRLAALQKLP